MINDAYLSAGGSDVKRVLEYTFLRPLEVHLRDIDEVVGNLENALEDIKKYRNISVQDIPSVSKLWDFFDTKKEENLAKISNTLKSLTTQIKAECETFKLSKSTSSAGFAFLDFLASNRKFLASKRVAVSLKDLPEGVENLIVKEGFRPNSIDIVVQSTYLFFNTDDYVYTYFLVYNLATGEVTGKHSYMRNEDAAYGTPLDRASAQGKDVPIKKDHIIIVFNKATSKKWVTIYVSPENFQSLMLPAGDDVELTDIEKVQLYMLNHLKAFARKYFKEAMAKLVALGFATPRNSITVKGKNYVHEHERELDDLYYKMSDKLGLY